MHDLPTSYRGRFAPSPTGPMHFGSLIAGLASFLDARANGGTWLVRMEDLDPPREQAGAAERILKSLQFHGLHSDEEPIWQSRRGDAYKKALSTLARIRRTFNCDCSRKNLSQSGGCGAQCRSRQDDIKTPFATRFSTAGHRVQFHDALQGVQPPESHCEPDDFVVKRKDGLYAYHLAVVVDDAYQGISHIVRGCDLLDSTAHQIVLQQALGYPTPHYSHLPVIINAQGQKLSKQTHAAPLDDNAAAKNLRRALAFLNQAEPPAQATTIRAILNFAAGHWTLESVPKKRAIFAVPDSTPV